MIKPMSRERVDGVLLSNQAMTSTNARMNQAHWVHDRPGYRCRHGRTSGQPGARTHSKILYVREDHLLARILADRQLRQQLPGLDRQDADEVSRGPWANDMIVVCDHTSWAVESDTIRFELAPTLILGLTAVPVQQDGGAIR
jgi:hypothetical protein